MKVHFVFLNALRVHATQGCLLPGGFCFRWPCQNGMRCRVESGWLDHKQWQGKWKTWCGTERRYSVQKKEKIKTFGFRKNGILCMKSKVFQFRKKIQIQKNAIPCMKSKIIQFRKKIFSSERKLNSDSEICNPCMKSQDIQFRKEEKIFSSEWKLVTTNSWCLECARFLTF